MYNYSHYLENPDEYLECQQCGSPIRHMTPKERDHMFYNPYDWIAYCGPCKKDGIYIPDLI